nr:formin-like protein 4 [Ipomoea batatas]
MAATFSPSMNLHSHSLLSFLIIILSAIPLCFSQPQNIQTFYPFPLPPLRPPPIPTTPTTPTRKAVGTAIGATAAGVLVLSGIFFVIFVRYSRSRRERGGGIAVTNPYADPYPNGSRDVGDRDEFSRFGGKVKGVIVDEEGLDVLYWRKLESGDAKESFKRQVFSNNGEKVEEKRMIAISTAPPPPPVAPPLSAPFKSQKPPPPLPHKGIPGDKPSSEQGTSGNGKEQVKLKPLHWDKVNANADHSMVWKKIEGGSFKFDGDLMEALFGSVAVNRKSPQRDRSSSGQKGEISAGPSPQIFILDTRKSQNIAIVLKSLGVPRREIMDALNEGQGLSAETLEKLCRVAPTREEESDILNFAGDPTRLADAESFLFYILKAIPSAFTRFNAMLFRSNYGPEILHLNESLQTLELASNELRGQRLFMKLLEAILKAGNRMNAGTSRGDAQAFNLTALRKLSDVKSIDGKTTLLHFVVQEVIRAEGRRCVLTRNHSLSRSGSQISSIASSDYDQEKEYIILGLPIVGGLSSEFSNVKKAAAIDYDALSKTSLTLSSQVSEIRKLVAQYGAARGGFATEMTDFLDSAEGEIKGAREQEIRVMEIVKRTTDYYQVGASNNKTWQPLQLFVIISDFLGMVDRVCVEIARNLQKKNPEWPGAGSSSSSTTESPAARTVRFPKLPANFLSEQSKSNPIDSTEVS